MARLNLRYSFVSKDNDTERKVIGKITDNLRELNATRLLFLVGEIDQSTYKERYESHSANLASLFELLGTTYHF